MRSKATGGLSWGVALVLGACGGGESAPGHAASGGAAGGGAPAAGGSNGGGGTGGSEQTGGSGGGGGNGACGQVSEPCCGSACGAGLTCESGACVQKPVGDFGKACTKAGDCPAGLCVPVAAGKNSCTIACTAESECLAGWQCAPILGQTGNVCQCTVKSEQCNGKDDDCNGVVDDAVTVNAGCESQNPAWVCKAGACECAVQCAGGCVNAKSNKHNCGTCGAACEIRCVDGSCVIPKQVVAGDWFSCARLSDGSVDCWGKDSKPDGIGNKPTGQQGLVGVTRLAVGGSTVCAESANAIFCRRSGKTTWQDTGLKNVALVAASTENVFALEPDGTLRCKGDNGVFGPAMGCHDNGPLVSGLTGVVQVAASGLRACAILQGSKLACWGASGPLGDGTNSGKAPPGVAVGAPDAVQIQLGFHSCARQKSGGVMCWGDNSYGQLGDSTAGGSKLVPATVSNLGGVVDLALGPYSTCAVMTDGSATCWGRNESGQLGSGSTGSPVTAPQPALQGLANIASLALGDFHGCAIANGGQVYCWGSNEFGQVGDGTTVAKLSAAKVIW